MRQVSRSLGGASYILLAASLWGTTATARTFAPASAGPVAVGAARVIGGGLLLLLVALRGGALRGLVTRGTRTRLPARHRRGGRRRVPDGLLRRGRPRRRRRRDGRHHRRGAGLHRDPVHGDGPAEPSRGPLAGRDGGRHNGLRHARHRRACIRSQRGGRRSGAARQPLLRGVRRHRLVPDHQRRRGPRRCRRHLWRRGRPAPAGPVHQPHELGGDRPGAWRSPPTSPCSPPRWPTSCTPGGCAPPR